METLTGSYETDVVLAKTLQFLVVAVCVGFGFQLLKPKTKYWAYALFLLGLVMFFVIGEYFDSPGYIGPMSAG